MAKKDKEAKKKGEVEVDALVGVFPVRMASSDEDKVGKDLGDEELAEAEDSGEDFEGILDETNFGTIPESDIEISDFSIGDIGLATANPETAFWKGDLETSLVDVPSNKWEEKHEEPEEKGPYSGTVDGRESGPYTEVEHGSDFYTGGGRGTDLYSSDSGNYNAKDESGEFYDPRIGKRTETDGVRQAGKSKLEITGLQSGFGQGTEKDIRDKREDKKYNN